MYPKTCISFAVATSLAAVVHAGPWVYSGPGYVNSPQGGYVNANINGNAHRVILNDGASIGDVNMQSPSEGDFGTVGMKYDAPASYSVLYPISISANSDFSTSVLAINQQRTIVGQSKKRGLNDVDLGMRATRWDLASGYDAVELNSLSANAAGVTFSKATSINASGLTVGNSSKYSGNVWMGNRAVRWNAGSTTPIELPITQFNVSATGFSNTFASAVNDGGTIVGTTEGYDNSQQFAGTRAIRWKANNTYAVLNPLGYTASNQTMCEAIDINNAGITVGVSNKYDYNNNQAAVGRRAVRWAPDTISGTELGGLGGTTVDGTTYAQVSSISDGGLILGQSNKYLLGAAIGNRAVYWQSTGSTAATELPHLGTDGAGITHGMARSANADGVVVGWYEKYTAGVNKGSRAVLWKTAGADSVTDLNTYLPLNSGWTLNEAVGVTDTGWVNGTGMFDADGQGGAAAYERLFQILVPSAGTYGRGDANFDTKTDFDDLLILAQNYGTSNNVHKPNVGDFDLNGSVNFDDLLLLAQNYGAGTLVGGGEFSESFASDWAMARSMTPEPVSISAITLLGCMARRRRTA